MMLVSPWPSELWPIWLILLILGIISCVHSQGRIANVKGQLTLLNNHTIFWQDREWTIKRVPLLLSFGIFLCLRSAEGNETQCLWLAIDSMQVSEWRGLRYGLSKFVKPS